MQTLIAGGIRRNSPVRPHDLVLLADHSINDSARKKKKEKKKTSSRADWDHEYGGLQYDVCLLLWDDEKCIFTYATFRRSVANGLPRLWRPPTFSRRQW